MFVKITWFNGLAITTSTSLLILNLTSGQYGQFSWNAATDTKKKVYDATSIIVSNAKPANITTFGEAEFKAIYNILKRGADRRDIESKLGRGKPDDDSNRVRYRSQNGRELEAEYSEDGGLQQWQWTDEKKPKIEGANDV